ncbi:MAG: chemotaxis protein CheA, partial [Bacillota bacterium]|nr:chemotaxis protein CheA [Bacillota bacterium]
MDMNQYLEIFIDESKEHLQQMNEILLNMETDQENLSYLGEIFRIAHTLKGMSGTMGFNKLMNLTHKMETLMDLVRNGSLKVSPVIIDALFECLDTLEKYVENLEKIGNEGDIDSEELSNKLVRIAQGGGFEAEKKETPSTEQVLHVNANVDSDRQADGEFKIEYMEVKDLIAHASEMGAHAYLIRVVLENSCLLKAARAFIVFNTLENFGEVIMSHPSPEDIEDERFEFEFEILYLTKLSSDLIQSELMKVSEVAEVIVKPIEIAAEEKKPADVEVPLDKLDDSEKASSKAQANTPSQSGNQSADKNKGGKMVRVEIGRLDNLMNLVSELIIIKNRLEELGAEDKKANSIDEAIEYLERITTDLHTAVMKVRMVPVEHTFNRFPRLVRDLSKDLGKNIKLMMSGEETEVDRTVIDEIGEPLIHLIRNSLDHGVESPDEREKSGKNPQGTVALRAYPDGNTVVIEVEDDGRGINPEKIKNKALEKGIVTEEAVAQMKDKEIINLLFRAGFSTAETVTDVSGRGVGLDVVKAKIEAINGTVEVDTEWGKGSKFIIRLPLTLAIIDALMVRLSEEKFAIPLNNIKEIIS